MRNATVFLLMAGLAVAAPAKRIEAQPNPAIEEAIPASKIVHVSDRDVIPVRTRLRFSTMIVLPKDENILEIVCGDKEFWQISGAQNFAYVKPSKENSETNLNLITAAGNVYSFTLREGTEANLRPDLKIFVEPKEGMLTAMKQAPRFVAASQVADYQDQIALAKAEADKAREEAQKAVADAQAKAKQDLARAKAGLASTMVYDYAFKDQPGFNIQVMFHDEKFTYVVASPEEAPTIYEYRDGDPSMIQFTFNGDLYTVPKVIGRGYFQIGKRKLHFEHKER
jgi:type IV secretory pathway VirB9-like protein